MGVSKPCFELNCLWHRYSRSLLGVVLEPLEDFDVWKNREKISRNNFLGDVQEHTRNSVLFMTFPSFYVGDPDPVKSGLFAGPGS
jgi:hypothetical protein